MCWFDRVLPQSFHSTQVRSGAENIDVSSHHLPAIKIQVVKMILQCITSLSLNTHNPTPLHVSRPPSHPNPHTKATLPTPHARLPTSPPPLPNLPLHLPPNPPPLLHHPNQKRKHPRTHQPHIPPHANPHRRVIMARELVVLPRAHARREVVQHRRCYDGARVGEEGVCAVGGGGGDGFGGG